MTTQAENERSTAEAIIAGFESADKALGLYNTLVDRVIQWETVKTIIDDLNSFQNDYFKEVAEIIGEIKTLMMNASHEYFFAAQSVYEWCTLTSTLLGTYVQLLKTADQKTSSVAQTTLVVRVLDEGITKMNAALAKLEQSSLSFNKVSGKLVTLDLLYQNAFDTKISQTKSKLDLLEIITTIGTFLITQNYTNWSLETSVKVTKGVTGMVTEPIEERLNATTKVFSAMKSKLGEANTNIDDTVAELKVEMKIISEIKIQTETTKAYIPLEDVLRDIVVETAEKLIRQCNEYRQRHAEIQ